MKAGLGQGCTSTPDLCFLNSHNLTPHSAGESRRNLWSELLKILSQHHYNRTTHVFTKKIFLIIIIKKKIILREKLRSLKRVNT